MSDVEIIDDNKMSAYLAIWLFYTKLLLGEPWYDEVTSKGYFAKRVT